MRVWTLIIIILCFTLVACVTEELRTDVNREKCISEKKVPLNCLSINVNDHRDEFVIILDQFDAVELKATDIVFFNKFDCNVKKMGTTHGKYRIVAKCEKSLFNKDINGTMKVTYLDFKDNPQTFEAKYIRTFGPPIVLYDKSVFGVTDEETPWYEK